MSGKLMYLMFPTKQVIYSYRLSVECCGKRQAIITTFRLHDVAFKLTAEIDSPDEPCKTGSLNNLSLSAETFDASRTLCEARHRLFASS